MKRIGRTVALAAFGTAVTLAGIYVLLYLPSLVTFAVGLVIGVLVMAFCASAGSADREREWRQMMDQQAALLARVQRERNIAEARLLAREEVA